MPNLNYISLVTYEKMILDSENRGITGSQAFKVIETDPYMFNPERSTNFHASDFTRYQLITLFDYFNTRESKCLTCGAPNSFRSYYCSICFIVADVFTERYMLVFDKIPSKEEGKLYLDDEMYLSIHLSKYESYTQLISKFSKILETNDPEQLEIIIRNDTINMFDG